MRTRSSSNLVGESSPNLTSSNPRRRNFRRSKQPFILEESPVDTMADQRTMAELLRAPTEGYAEEIVVPPILAEHFELKHSERKPRKGQNQIKTKQKREAWRSPAISNITPLVWKSHLDNQLDVELLDLYDRCYARQAVMDNTVNQRAWELLKVVKQMKGECDVLKERERARDNECKELRAKCEAAMADFNNNLAVNVLREKITALFGEVASLEAEKARLKAVETSLRQEVENVKHDRAELVSSAVFYGRCAAFEEVTKIKEPFDLSKVKALVEALLSKKPPTLQCTTQTRTHAPAPSSQKATTSSTPVSKPQSPSLAT
nr:hypothetical protein [Tanacetum cinerariifolium]